jgi:hypothetical protein
MISNLFYFKEDIQMGPIMPGGWDYSTSPYMHLLVK